MSKEVDFAACGYLGIQSQAVTHAQLRINKLITRTDSKPGSGKAGAVRSLEFFSTQRSFSKIMGGSC